MNYRAILPKQQLAGKRVTRTQFLDSEPNSIWSYSIKLRGYRRISIYQFYSSSTEWTLSSSIHSRWCLHFLRTRSGSLSFSPDRVHIDCVSLFRSCVISKLHHIRFVAVWYHLYNYPSFSLNKLQLRQMYLFFKRKYNHNEKIDDKLYRWYHTATNRIWCNLEMTQLRNNETQSIWTRSGEKNLMNQIGFSKSASINDFEWMMIMSTLY
jgi:hypothetical protein